MKWVYKTLRALLVACLALAVLVPVGLYIAFSMPGTQNKLRQTAESQLTDLLGMKVGIENVYIAPFSRVTLRHVSLTDSVGDTAVSVDRLGAGISIPRLIFKRRIVMTYAEIIGLDAKIRRDSAGAPLNIQLDDRRAVAQRQEQTSYSVRLQGKHGCYPQISLQLRCCQRTGRLG